MRSTKLITNISIYSFIIIVIVFVTYQMFFLQMENKNLIKKTKILETNNKFQKHEIEEMHYKLFLTSKITNSKINNSTIYNENYDSCLLDDLINSYKIILHYSSLSCLDCVNKEVKKIKLLSKKIGNENVIILASYYNERDLLIFKRINGLIDNLVYRIKENSTGLITDSLNIPTLMVIDSSLIIKELCFPNVDYPEISNQFYDIVINKYFSNNNCTVKL